jgi:acetoin utilization deacetylase AcuC-like enzyme
LGGVLVYYSNAFRLHYPPRDSGHLEAPIRLWRATKGLRDYGLEGRLEFAEPGSRGLSTFKAVHDAMYLAELESEIEAGMDSYFIDADTYVSPGTGAALEALAASALGAVERVRSGGGPVLILGRPPGHHAGVAGPGLGAPSLGGCLVNTAALVALKLVEAGYRVAILDFDLNHGNGTEEILQALRPERVVLVDVHQDWRETFPWTGEPGSHGDAPVLSVNLPKGSGDDIGTAVMAGVRGLLEDLNPDAVVVSAGFDGYQGDSPLTKLKLGSQTFHAAGRAVSKWPVVAVLETGFTVGLERGLPAFVSGLLGLPDPVGDPATESPGHVWSEFEELNKEVVEY